MAPSRALTALHAGLQSYYFDGACYLRGGGPTIPDTLAKHIKLHGGEFLRGADVERILVESGRAVAVRLPSLLEEAPQHPRGLLVHLHALGEQIAGGLIARALGRLEDLACGARHRLVAHDEEPDHVLRFRHAVVLPDRRELCELLVRAGRSHTERANALGDEIDREGEFVVLRLEHEMQRLEPSATDGPTLTFCRMLDLHA